MTIDLNFLMFLIGLLTLMGMAFGFFTKLLLRIEKTITQLAADMKSTKEYHTCEFDRVNKKLDDLTEEVNKHEARLVKLENTKNI